MCILKCILYALLWMGSITVSTQKLQAKKLVTLHKWTNLQLSFPTEVELSAALKHGYYNKNSPLPVDLDIEYGDDGYHRTFLTIPRLGLGVPYSLAVVADSDNATVLNPKVVAYPNYDWHSSHGANCSNITSAIRIFIDECWRLWIVDSGQMNSMQFCPPQILAFDLVTDRLVHRYVMPNTVYSPAVSVFTALAVDVGDAEPHVECRDTMVYIADPWGYGLIVHNALTMKSWRVEHKLMRPDTNLQKLNSANDGIFTVSLSPKRATKGERLLYFHALNSFKEISVALNIVNNATMWSGKSRTTTDAFHVVGNRGTQCESEVMDSTGHLFCSLISSTALISWLHETDYNSDTLQVVAYSPEQVKFVTGLKVNRNSLEQDELWMLSNDPKLFVGGKVKPGGIKFQIVGCRTSDLLNNSKCSVGARSFGPYN